MDTLKNKDIYENFGRRRTKRAQKKTEKAQKKAQKKEEIKKAEDKFRTTFAEAKVELDEIRAKYGEHSQEERIIFDGWFKRLFPKSFRHTEDHFWESNEKLTAVISKTIRTGITVGAVILTGATGWALLVPIVLALIKSRYVLAFGAGWYMYAKELILEKAQLGDTSWFTQTLFSSTTVEEAESLIAMVEGVLDGMLVMTILGPILDRILPNLISSVVKSVRNETVKEDIENLIEKTISTIFRKKPQPAPVYARA